MSERLETLKKARERMTNDRDAFAKVLAAPFDRDKAERARIGGVVHLRQYDFGRGVWKCADTSTAT